MIKKVRRKFIIVSMAAIVVCTMLLAAAINLVNFYQIDQENLEILQRIAENNGKFPEFDPENQIRLQNGEITGEMQPNPQEPSPNIGFGGKKFFAAEAAYETRFFTVKFADDIPAEADLRNIASVDEETALSLAEQMMAENSSTGYYGYYKYYVSNDTNGNHLMVVMDCETKLYGIRSLAYTSLLIALAGIGLMFLTITLCSKRIIQPVIESTEKQKQFITDASHELKTPLTVIATNMDILQMDLKENEWVEGTRKQVKHMRSMVNQMVSLSRMEEENQEKIVARFDVSKAVLETAEPFAAMAEFEEKIFSMEVTEHLELKGEEGAVRQLVTILCDNAVKYAPPKGEIALSLTPSHGGRKLLMEISNSCESKIEEKSLSRLFDRFYRADASRTKENGKSSYGIGLAIAKAIVDRHNGKISVRQDAKNIVTFKVIL